MDRKYSVTEPHPSIPKGGSAYLSGGRGGAGNYKRYKSEDLTAGPTAFGPPSRMDILRPAQRRMRHGIGGAGNYFTTTPEHEETIFKFDEELIARREHQAPIYHVGRGGAGNLFDERQPQRTASTDSSSSDSTASSTGSVRRSMEGAFSKLQRKLSKPNTNTQQQQ